MSQESPLPAALDKAVQAAVAKQFAQQIQALAAEKFAEAMTPELWGQLEAAASEQMAAQIDALTAGGGGEAPSEVAAEQAPPKLVFSSAQDFMRAQLAPMYRRDVTSVDRRRWCPEWWRHGEALDRVKALWRTWEAARLDPVAGMSIWWKDHADVHMAALMDEDGPFMRCSVRDGHNGAIPSLPIVEPPPELFPPD